MDHLVVDHQLATSVVDDQSTNAATAVSKGVAESLEETTLVEDGDTLLDIAGLGHGDDVAVLDVQDAVGLVDGAQHGLDDDRVRGVGDEARLLVQLTGEQVDTEVAVLAGLGGDRDADHLARTALEDQEIANADEVAGDRDGVGRVAAARTNDANILTAAGGGTLLDDDVLLGLAVEGVEEAIGRTLDAAAEGVVVAFVVVVTHLGLGVFLVDGGLAHVDLGGSGVAAAGTVGVDVYLTSAAAGVVAAVGLDGLVSTGGVGSVDFVGRWVDATAIFTLGDIKLGLNFGAVRTRTVMTNGGTVSICFFQSSQTLSQLAPVENNSAKQLIGRLAGSFLRHVTKAMRCADLLIRTDTGCDACAPAGNMENSLEIAPQPPETWGLCFVLFCFVFVFLFYFGAAEAPASRSQLQGNWPSTRER